MKRYGVPSLVILWFSLAAVLLLTAGRNLLGQRVAQLEALVAEQQAELNKQPVVIDANGVEVGTVIGQEGSFPVVLFDFDDLPLFTLELIGDSLRGSESTLSFTSTDCTGTALLPHHVGRVLQGRFHPQDESMT